MAKTTQHPAKPSGYNCEPLAELARELVYSKPALRGNQLRRAERLHDEITPDATYPLDYLSYRVTGVRPTHDATVLLVGEAVAPDLRRLVDEVSKTLELTIHEDGGSKTAAQLATELNVSTKTISRWRKAGLRWRWVVDQPGGQKKIGFTAQAVRKFIEDHRQRVEAASGFTHLAEDTRDEMIQRARRIRGRVDEVSLNRVADHLARKTGRALETIRMLLEKHDRENPGDMIFADHTGPLSPKQKRVIARAYRWGMSVAELARRFERTRSTVYRAINERRAVDVLAMEIRFVKSPTFDRDDADAVYLRTEPRPDLTHRQRKQVSVDYDDLPETLGPLYRRHIMGEAYRRSLLLRYNYLKFKADAIRSKMDRREPRVTDLDRFDKCMNEAGRIRSRIVAGALPLVLSVARRNLVGKPGKSKLHLVHLLEAGNQVLIDAVDEFDATKNTAFESYLTNRLLRRFVSDDAEQSHRPRKAMRRRSDTEVLKRMVDQAGESGVALQLDPEVADNREA